MQTAAPDEEATSSYDAAGRMTVSQTAQTRVVRYYDGNGREIKRQTSNYSEAQNKWIYQPVKYFVRSSVLGNETVSEVWGNGKKGKTFVRAAGEELAFQSAHISPSAALNEFVFFEYADASGMSQRTRDKTGAATATVNNYEGSPVELDPIGSSVGISSPYVAAANTFGFTPYNHIPVEIFSDSPFFTGGGGGFGGGGGGSYATLDGVSVPYWFAISALQNGSAVQCPNNNCGPRVYSVNGQNVLSSPFQAYGDGTSGYNVRVTDRNGFTVDGVTTWTETRSWRFQAVDTSNSFWNISRQSQNQPLAPLPEKKDNAINNVLKELTDFLKDGKFSEDCQKNVIDKLNTVAGFSLEKFISFLELGGDFFDGTRSTASAKDYNPDYGYDSSTTVADSFKISRATNARTANGINNKFTVFFRPESIETKKKKSRLTGEKISGITNDNLAFIYHEGLHAYGHYSKNGSLYDDDLQTLFGLPATASINISEYIKENCFEYTD